MPNPFHWIASLYRGPEPKYDKRFVDATQWREQFRATSEMPGKLALQHVRHQYDAIVANWDRIDRKLAHLLTVSGVLGAILVAAAGSKELALPVTWPVRIAFVCLLLAALLVIWVRRVAKQGFPCSIRPLFDEHSKLEKPEDWNPEAWLAASIFDTVERLHVTIDWAARYANASAYLIAAALIVLLSVVFA